MRRVFVDVEDDNGFLYRRDFLVTSDALRQIVEENLGYRNLEDAKLPVHIVATHI